MQTTMTARPAPSRSVLNHPAMLKAIASLTGADASSSEFLAWVMHAEKGGHFRDCEMPGQYAAALLRWRIGVLIALGLAR